MPNAIFIAPARIFFARAQLMGELSLVISSHSRKPPHAIETFCEKVRR